MEYDIQRNLAKSLTSESIAIIPYLPYLLQDFWELGSCPESIIALLRKNDLQASIYHVLDLACGKGAVSVKLAKELGIRVKGIDIIPEFIMYARKMAFAHRVKKLCTFLVDDVNNAVEHERDFDCLIWSAAGNILGNYRQTLDKITRTVKPGGYVVLDDCYVKETIKNKTLRFHNSYPNYTEWQDMFGVLGLTLIDRLEAEGNWDQYDFDTDNQKIKKRADELIALHPDKRNMFLTYCQNQMAECEDLKSDVFGVIWLLKKE